MAHQVRDTSGFAPASHQSLALCLGTLGISLLLWPIAVWGFPSPSASSSRGRVQGQVSGCSRGPRRHWRLHEMELDLNDGDGFNPARMTEASEVAHSNLSPEVLENAQYQRLRDDVEYPHLVPGSKRKPWGVVTDAKVSGGQLISYKIQTLKSGLTVKNAAVDRVQQLEALLDPGVDNRWEIKADSRHDLVIGKLVKDLLPKAIAPEPPASVVRDVADAVRRYSSARWILGVDATGAEVSYPLPEGFPHVLVAGGTGGGKSVWARTTIETLRVQGFACFIASGKDTDFAALSGQPGIGMVAEGPAQTAVMVRTIRREMDRRFREVKKVLRDGGPKAFNFQPILVLLDEWGSTEMEMRARYKKIETFMEDLDLLLRKGRECRIHVVLLSQTIRKQGPGAVPGSWQSNLRLTVSLGEPEEVTLQSDAFTEQTRPEARRIGARLKGKAGRGMIADRETGRVVEFQSYYGWSPGQTSLEPGADKNAAPPTDEVRAVWERWVPVSASVPLLQPRRGFKASGPDWAVGELEDVANTPTIALTDSSGRPMPEREKYDPRSPLWVGDSGDTDFEGIGFD